MTFNELRKELVDYTARQLQSADISWHGTVKEDYRTKAESVVDDSLYQFFRQQIDKHPIFRS